MTNIDRTIIHTSVLKIKVHDEISCESWDEGDIFPGSNDFKSMGNLQPQSLAWWPICMGSTLGCGSGIMLNNDFYFIRYAFPKPMQFDSCNEFSLHAVYNGQFLIKNTLKRHWFKFMVILEEVKWVLLNFVLYWEVFLILIQLLLASMG